jgi:hypothetical protein
MAAMARLAKVRQDTAMAKARRLASEFAKAKDLNEQVIQYADQYGEAAVRVAQQGVSVAMLRDTMAFRVRLLAGAKDQELANADLFKRFQEAASVRPSTRPSSRSGRRLKTGFRTAKTHLHRAKRALARKMLRLIQLYLEKVGLACPRFEVLATPFPEPPQMRLGLEALRHGCPKASSLSPARPGLVLANLIPLPLN